VEGSGRGIIRVTFPGIYLEELRPTSRIFRIVCSGRESKGAPLEYESEGLLLEYIFREKTEQKYTSGKYKSDVGHVWRLVAGFSSRRPVFSARSVYVGFEADKVTLERGFP
jgi:hypothetical protein